MSRQIAQTHQQKPSATPLVTGLLQRKCACGNHTLAGGECEECSKKKRFGLQTKLKVNDPGDIYEQEADRVADEVLAASTHSGVSGRPPCIQRYSGQSNEQIGAAPASVDHTLSSPGRPLERALRQEMEQYFGYDFSSVRVHSSVAAEQSTQDVNAHAYTVGHNIVFGADQFAPETHAGRRLLAHELTHVVQQARSGIAAIQCYSDATILAELEQKVAKEDTEAQRLRIEHLTEIFSDLAMGEATDLLQRLTARKKGDKLAAEFHYRLSTKSRQKLLGILQKTAVTLPLVKVFQPTDDPKYIDKVIDEVEFRPFLQGDRYYLKWKGGRTTVYRPDVDTTGKSKAIPILPQIYDSKTSALAAAAEWSDLARAGGYDTVVAYYRGAADVLLPTWISPETAPVTYDLMRGVSNQATQTAASAYEFFRGLRNGMIVGAAVGGLLRVLGRVFWGGGGGAGPSTRGDTPPVAPKVEPTPTPKAEPLTGEPAPPEFAKVAPRPAQPAPPEVAIAASQSAPNSVIVNNSAWHEQIWKLYGGKSPAPPVFRTGYKGTTETFWVNGENVPPQLLQQIRRGTRLP